MAGVKGMKQARPKTPEERDAYAKNKIEYLLDEFVLHGRDVKEWDMRRLRALEMRYARLRPVLASTEIHDRREGWADALRRIAGHKQLEQQPAIEGECVALTPNAAPLPVNQDEVA